NFRKARRKYSFTFIDYLDFPVITLLLVTIDQISSIFKLLECINNVKKPSANVKCLHRIVNNIWGESIETRFFDTLMNKFLITAAVCYLQFKTVWIKNEVKKQMATEYLKNACYELHQNISENDSRGYDQIHDDLSSFFTRTQNVHEEKSTVSNEIDRFLGTSTAKTLECLHNLPTIKKFIIKYNTLLPSIVSAFNVF
ncbi:uncharacterized protein LOC126898293, partial [Daktulosphaira vitifoliae]|uniref:uncharacterized protein LOC126898293 n=1 Tax=Daktulosphaira vitifoliae TaxID=58002 RepID=UPI0021AA3E1F